MRLSRLMSKTSRDAPRDEVSKNAQLLIKAGYIYKEMAGAYVFLPLGLKVLNNIISIIRDEMDAVGGQEVFMTSLQSPEQWKASGRWSDDVVDVWFKSSLQSGAEIGFANTHEEQITKIMSGIVKSHKDLPHSIYQFQNKFRNEVRSKSGIMRTREFIMKDLYTFSKDKEQHQVIYDDIAKAYNRIFERLGISEQTFFTLASGGSFSKYSHEFQTRCDAGEDLVFAVADEDLYYNLEIAPSRAPEIDDSDVVEKELQEIEARGVIGVEKLAKLLELEIDQTTKTMLFESPNGVVVAAAVRGGYDVNVLKLEEASGYQGLQLASEQTVRKTTGAEVGYAGIIGLPDDVEIYLDDSMQGRRNFEVGANKTNYHTINVNFGRDIPTPERFYDIKDAKDGDYHPESGKQYQVFKAAEVGNIFTLGTKYSDAIGLKYSDETGQQKSVFMGSYGLGPARTMGVITELMSDDKGLVWPENIAPAKVIIVQLGDSDDVRQTAESMYEKLKGSNLDVMLDDRDERAGVKLADSDLIGVPYRVVISNRSCQADQHELTERLNGATSLHGFDDLIEKLTENIA
jgi:prolyl-tRNA synthetase